MAEWEIKKSLGKCFGTGCELAVGQEYYAALAMGDQGLERRDFSIDYWQTSKPPVYCFWKSKVANPEQKKKLFVDDAMLMAFFDRLAAETEQDKLNFRFVLALILMRKRRLKYNSSRIDDRGELWTLRVVGEDRNEEVLYPRLTEEQIGQLTEQMGQILQTNFE